jgi:hypothetical protein
VKLLVVNALRRNEIFNKPQTYLSVKKIINKNAVGPFSPKTITTTTINTTTICTTTIKQEFHANPATNNN